MAIRIVINGREVTNPFAKFTITVLSVALFCGVALFALFIAVPLIGLTLTVITGFFLAVFCDTLLTAIVCLPPFNRCIRRSHQIRRQP